MKPFFVNHVAKLLYISGAIASWRSFLRSYHKLTTRFPLLPGKFFERVRILTYHRVNNNYDPFFKAIPTQLFEQQMRYLRTYCSIISFSDLIAAWENGKNINNPVIITFDDGCKDNYTHAFPILMKYQIPATIFLTTGLIGSGKNLWLDRISYGLKYTKRKIINFPGKRELFFPIKTIEEKISARMAIYHMLIQYQGDEKNRIVEHICNQLSVKKTDELENMMLNWEEVKSMRKEGIEFGGHTVTHPILSRISVDQARKEIAESKRYIENQIQNEVISFAYPRGKSTDLNQSIIKLVQDTGYKIACTTIPGIVVQDSTLDPYCLNRLSLVDPVPVFAAKLEWTLLSYPRNCTPT